MRIKSYFVSAGVLAIGAVTLMNINYAQGPLYDKVMVKLPYTVRAGDKTLPPGDYVIRQLPSDGGGRNVLLVYSDNGMKFETSSMTIPALDNQPANETKVILHQFGNEYYFDKVWIQGKNYGYEFPVPENVKSRQLERKEPVNVSASYQSTNEAENNSKVTNRTATEPALENRTTTEPARGNVVENNSTVSNSTATSTNTTTTTTAETAPEPAAATQAVPALETPPARETSQNQAAQTSAPDHAAADASRAAVPAPASPRADTSTAMNRSSDGDTTDRTMPATSADWLLMMLAGSTLSCAGLAIRRSAR